MKLANYLNLKLGYNTAEVKHSILYNFLSGPGHVQGQPLQTVLGRAAHIKWAIVNKQDSGNERKI